MPSPDGTGETESSDEFLRLTCGSCDHRFRVKTSRARSEMKCPKCKAPVRVPDASGVSGRQRRPAAAANRFARLAKKLPEKPHTAAGDDWAPENSLSNRAFKKLETTISTSAPGKKETLTEANQRRSEAMKTLAESRDGRACEVLVAQLEDSSPTVRSAAISGLGEVGDPRAVPALVALLDLDDADVRRDAVNALGKIGDRRSVRALMMLALDDPELKFPTSGAITSMGEIATPELLELLNDDEPGHVLEAVVLLGRIRDKKAVKALTAVIESRSALFRAHAAESLGLIDDERAATVLSGLLRDDEASVRVSAAVALGRMPKAANAKALVRALRDPDEDVRRLSATALGEIGDKRAGDALATLLDDGDARVREAATIALGRVGDDRAIEPLFELLELDDDDTVLRAIGAFRQLRDPAAVEGLTDFLYHERTAIRQRAVESLGLIGDSAAAESIEGVLKGDRSAEVRTAAAKALGEIRDPGSLDALEQALQDEFQVRCRAVVALGAIGDEQSLPAILAMLKDPVPEVRYQATTAVAELGKPSGMAPLEALLDDENQMVRRGAAKALIKLGDERGDALLEIAAEPGKQKKSKRKKISTGGSLIDFKSLKSISPAELLAMAWPDSQRGKAIAIAVVAVPLLLVGAMFFASGRSNAVMLRGQAASADLDATGEKVFVGRTQSGLVEVWSVSGRSLVEQRIVPTLSDVSHIAVSADGAGMLVGGNNGMLFVGADGQPVALAPKVSRIVSSADRSFAISVNGPLCRVWNLSTGTELAAFQTGAVSAVAVGNGGTRVAAALPSGKIAVYDVATPSNPLLHSPSGTVKGLAFDDTAARLFAGLDDGTLQAWAVGVEAPTATVPTEALVESVYFAGGKVFAGADETYFEWDGVGQPQRRNFDAPLMAVVGNVAATGVPTEQSKVVVVDVENGDSLASLDVRVADPYRR